MLRSFLLLLVVISTSACAKTTFVRSAPDYQETLKRSKLVLVVPPEISVHTIDASGKKTKMYNYEDKLEDLVTDTIISKLSEKGFDVKLLSRKEIHNNKLSNDIINLKDNFVNLTTELYASGPWKEDQAFSVEKSINGTAAIHKKLNADLVVMSNFSLDSKTSGALAVDFTKRLLFGALGTSSDNGIAESALMKLAFIEASTGKLLWMHSVFKNESALSTTIDNMSDANKVDKEKLDTLCNASLKDLKVE